MYYYINKNNDSIFIRSKDTLKNLIDVNIITQETQIKIGLRGQFLKAIEIQEIKDFFINDHPIPSNVLLEKDFQSELKSDNEDIELEIPEPILENKLLDNDLVLEKEIIEPTYNEKPFVIPEIITNHKPTAIKNIMPSSHQGTYRVNFQEAIKLGFQNSFNFNDRSSRSEYWFFSLFYLLSSIVVFFLDGMAFGYEVNGAFSIIIDFIFFFPSISLIVRRLHDVNRSGWWFLIVLTGIGLLVILYWYLKKGCEKSNRFGKCSLGALRKRS